jgi:hypothetical protein
MNGVGAEEAKFHKLLATLAMRARTELDDVEIEVYDKHLGPHGYGEVNAALEQLLVERGGNDPFPSIRKVLETMGKGELSEKSVVTDAASKIVGLINRFGFYLDHNVKRLGYDTVEACVAGECGPIGAEAVRLMGGYFKVWDTVVSDPKGWKFGVRDAVQLAAERARQQQRLKAPALAAPGRKMIAGNSK